MAGWLWGNSSGSSDRGDSSSSTAHDAENPQPPPPSKSTPTTQPTHKPSSSRTAASSLDKLDRDEQRALEELRAALFPSRHENASTTATDATTTSNLTPQEKQTSEAMKNSIYPDTLSCSACFDAAYYCSSVGGQLNNIYRYGGLRSCSELWAQWRFCMRTKTMGEEEKRRRVWEWNRDKEVRKRIGRSSEDVWELRRGGWEDVPEGEGRGLFGSSRGDGGGDGGGTLI